MSLGSIFKNIGNIFKTSEELEAEKRRQKRSLERGIEKSSDALNDGQRQAAREQEKFYQQGKQKLSVGRDAEARQFFQFSRMQARNAENYTRQKLMWSNALTQIKVAANMQTAAACFKDLAVQCGLNPDVFENGLESMEDVESTIGEMNKAYVRTAISRGNDRTAVLTRHVLKNSLVSVVTFLGQTMAELIGGSVVVEQVFGIPGLGRLLVASISTRDYPVVQTVVVILAFWVVLAGTVADLVNQRIDPRLRLGGDTR